MQERVHGPQRRNQKIDYAFSGRRKAFPKEMAPFGMPRLEFGWRYVFTVSRRHSLAYSGYRFLQHDIISAHYLISRHRQADLRDRLTIEHTPTGQTYQRNSMATDSMVSFNAMIRLVRAVGYYSCSPGAPFVCS